MQTDEWSSGDVYEPYVGRWSRRVAPRFLEWLGWVANTRWLDVGCGTGALTSCIAADCAPRLVVGVDPSAGYVEYSRQAAGDGQIQVLVGDGSALPFGSGSVDYVVSGLVLNFLPDPVDALAQQRRICRPGGTVAAYVWDYAEGMQLMRRFWDAAVSLDPHADELDEGRRFPICQPDRLISAFDSAGLDAVETGMIDVPTVFRDFDDYWTPFLGGQAPAPRYCMSLDEPARGKLREALRETLPIHSDGSIHLVARAWTVRGTADSAGG